MLGGVRVVEFDVLLRAGRNVFFFNYFVSYLKVLGRLVHFIPIQSAAIGAIKVKIGLLVGFGCQF